MRYTALRDELHDFYDNRVQQISENFNRECSEILEKEYDEAQSAYTLKARQYRVIAARCRPVLFAASPFYYELGSMAGTCDGCGEWRDGSRHPGGWLYRKREHLFADADPEMARLTAAQKEELLYLVCGPYTDARQHFCFNYRPVFSNGLKGLYEKAAAQLASAADEDERDFLHSVCAGLLALKQIAEKFSDTAARQLAACTDPQQRENLVRIRDTARRVPWEAPETLYEALNSYAFLRLAVGTLEGVGTNTFGRVDVDLYPIYLRDRRENGLTEEETYALIAQFLLTWDCRYDHDMKMEWYADHELENTYTLGGCDETGAPVWNELTALFLRVSREQHIIYPKIVCRFGEYSPKAYLDVINGEILLGTSTVLYQNDDATVPALLRAGRSEREARDYIVSGCWDVKTYGNEKPDAGAYVNILKTFEYSVHRRADLMKKTGLVFEPLDDAESFDEVYRITVENIRRLFRARSRLAVLGRLWPKVDPQPILSAGMTGCLENRRDYTAGGAKYNDEVYLCVGLPDVVDSLLAIRTLCFEQKKYTLPDFLDAVRRDWRDSETMRLDAVCCGGWGDGKAASSALARRLNADLYAALDGLPTRWSGRYLLGHLTYTEIRWWGQKTLATPNGRHSGDVICQGLTPSRLHRIRSTAAPLNSIAALGTELCAGNTVVNIILSPKGMDLDRAYAYLMAVAESGVQCLQLNCFSKEQLLDAQRHPERYPDLIVRVCGFSAKFTSLSPDWQEEVITRNFYD